MRLWRQRDEFLSAAIFYDKKRKFSENTLFLRITVV